MYLPEGTTLNNRYVIENVLGHGGFGITYAAYDKVLSVRVAIKEYLPRQLATRAEGQTKISIYTGEARQHYQYGLTKFLEEAQAVAKFAHHPNVVSARDYFEAHGTAYMVMEYVEGVTLKEYLENKGGRISFEEAKGIMMPVMDALREVHQAGLMHRDISPDNIYISTAAQVKVLDFGAARYAAGEQSKSLSVILKPGYAPEEQYRSSGKQGAWTDVYAVGATIYKCLTGKTPPDALDRKEKDTLEPPSRLGVAIPPEAEQALLRALAVKAPKRFKSMADFQQALLGGESMTTGFQSAPPPAFTPAPAPRSASAPVPPTPASQSSAPHRTRRSTSPAVIAAIVAGGVIGLLAVVLIIRGFMGPSGPDLLGKGLKEFQTQQYAEARKSLEAAALSAPNDARPLFQLALTYNRLKLFPQEIKAYQEVIRLDSGNMEAHYNLGVAYNREGKKNLALEEYNVIKSKNPELAKELFGIIYPNKAKELLAEGIKYLDAKDYEKARIAFDKSISHDTKDPEAHFRLASAYSNLKGRDEDAVKEYKKGLELEPKSYVEQLNLGLAHVKLQQHQQAIEALKKAIGLKPDFALAHFHLGGLYNSLGKKDLAQKEIETLKGLDAALAGKLEGESAKAGDLVAKGMDHLKNKDYEKAREALDQAVRLNSQDAKAYAQLALAYFGLKRDEDGIMAYRKSLEINPDNYLAYNNIGVTLDKMGKHEEAVEEFKKCIGRNANLPMAHYNLGRAYLKVGNKDGARQELEILKTTDQAKANDLLALIDKASPSQDDKGKPVKSTRQMEREIQRDTDRILERRRAEERGAPGAAPQVGSPARPTPQPTQRAAPARSQPSSPSSSGVIPSPKQW